MQKENDADLGAILASLRRDYTKLAVRIRALDHQIVCTCSGVTLRLHYPSFRAEKTTVQELVDLAYLHLTSFAMTRLEISKVDSIYGMVPVDEFKLKHSQLNEAAARLFMKAHKATNRTGEAGELLLYLLTEWILEAPQILAKMTLKTNSQMPVHGADGVHVRFCAITNRLLVYWGESKMYADVGAGITAAVASIAKALGTAEIGHELQLVQRNIDFTGMDEVGKSALLRYLDPHEEAYNERKDVVTCLVGFDFDGFGNVGAGAVGEPEAIFRDLARAKLEDIAPKIAVALTAAGISGQEIEFFFFPLPAVQEFRDMFQAKIGWLS